jgi:hypothetical protein
MEKDNKLATTENKLSLREDKFKDEYDEENRVKKGEKVYNAFVNYLSNLRNMNENDVRTKLYMYKPNIIDYLLNTRYGAGVPTMFDRDSYSNHFTRSRLVG